MESEVRPQERPVEVRTDETLRAFQSPVFGIPPKVFEIVSNRDIVSEIGTTVLMIRTLEFCHTAQRIFK